MPSILDPLFAVIAVFPYLLAALAFLVAGKYVFDLSTPGMDDDAELGEAKNPAFGVFWGGYVLALGIALSGALNRLGPDLGHNLIDLAISGAGAIVLLRLSMVLADLVVLRGFDVNHEIAKDRNLGAAFAYAGVFAAGGLVIAGVMDGRSDSWLLMVRDIAVYWVCGQVLLLGAWFAFGLTARYDVRKVLGEDNNAAAGLSLGGFFAAVGLVLRAALAGAGSDLGAELLVSAAAGIAALVLLSLARVLAAFAILPRLKLSKEVAVRGNLAAGAVSATLYLAVGLLLSTLIASQLH